MKVWKIIIIIFAAAAGCVIWFYIPVHITGSNNIVCDDSNEILEYDLTYHRRIFSMNYYTGSMKFKGKEYEYWKTCRPEMTIVNYKYAGVVEYLKIKTGMELPEFCRFYRSGQKPLDTFSDSILIIDSADGYKLKQITLAWSCEGESLIYSNMCDNVLIYAEESPAEEADSDSYPNDVTEVVFKGTVLEINDGVMLAAPEADSYEASSSDRFSIPIEHMSESSPEPEVGDTIEVVYSGVIEELYPALLKDITGIQVIKSETAGNGEDPFKLYESDNIIQLNYGEFYNEPAENTEDIKNAVIEYFNCWKNTETWEKIPATEEVVNHWKKIYSDTTVSSLDNGDGFTEIQYDDNGTVISVSFPFSIEGFCYTEENACALEVISLGYFHLLQLEKKDGTWIVTEDLRKNELHGAFAEEDIHAAEQIFTKTAEIHMDGITEEEIEEAEKTAVLICFKAPFSGNSYASAEDIEAQADLIEASYDPEFSKAQIVQYLLGANSFLSPDSKAVLVSVSAIRNIIMNGEEIDVNTFPSFLLEETDGNWVKIANVVRNN